MADICNGNTEELSTNSNIDSESNGTIESDSIIGDDDYNEDDERCGIEIDQKVDNQYVNQCHDSEGNTAKFNGTAITCGENGDDNNANNQQLQSTTRNSDDADETDTHSRTTTEHEVNDNKEKKEEGNFGKAVPLDPYELAYIQDEKNNKIRQKEQQSKSQNVEASHVYVQNQDVWTEIQDDHLQSDEETAQVQDNYQTNDLREDVTPEVVDKEEIQSKSIPVVPYDPTDAKEIAEIDGIYNDQTNEKDKEKQGHESQASQEDIVNSVVVGIESVTMAQQETSLNDTKMQQRHFEIDSSDSNVVKRNKASSQSIIQSTPSVAIENTAMAMVEKEQGNRSFKMKAFNDALEHYNEAIKLNSSNIVFYLSRAATYYELGKYENSIKDAHYAVEMASRQDIDAKLLARAYARLGYSYKQLNELSFAITYFNSSLKLRDSTKIRKECLDTEAKLIEKQKAAMKDKKVLSSRQSSDSVVDRTIHKPLPDSQLGSTREINSAAIARSRKGKDYTRADSPSNHSIVKDKGAQNGMEWDHTDLHSASATSQNDNESAEAHVSPRIASIERQRSKIESMKKLMEKDGITRSVSEMGPADSNSIWVRMSTEQSNSGKKVDRVPGIRRVKSSTASVRTSKSHPQNNSEKNSATERTKNPEYMPPPSRPHARNSANSIEPLNQDELQGRETGMHHPADLIRGVCYDAEYLGTTCLFTNKEWSTDTRINLAKEAIERIKVTSSDFQSCIVVEMVISVRSVIVLRSEDKQLLVETLLHNVSYVADIGNIVVLMTRRHKRKEDVYVQGKSGKAILEVSTSDYDEEPRGSQIVSHVFSSRYAQSVAKTVGQAFDIAYEDYLKDKGMDQEEIEQHEYDCVLSHQRCPNEDLNIFSDINCKKKIVIRKKRPDQLGIMVVPSGWGSLIPAPVVAHINKFGPAALGGQLNVGDHIMSVNNNSLVALQIDKCKSMIKENSYATEVVLEIVSMSPVVEIILRRPDTKYPWGFSVQDGLICSVIRGGIADRGGVRVGHNILSVDGQDIINLSHEQIVELLNIATGDLRMRTMPAAMFKLMTGRESPEYI